jgi:hypothetical protein
VINTVVPTLIKAINDSLNANSSVSPFNRANYGDDGYDDSSDPSVNCDVGVAVNTLRPFGQSNCYDMIDSRGAAMIQCAASVVFGIALSLFVLSLVICKVHWSELVRKRHNSNMVSIVFGLMFLMCGICGVISGTTWYPDPMPIGTQSARVLCFAGLTFFLIPAIFNNALYLSFVDDTSNLRRNITAGILIGLGSITFFIQIPVWIVGMKTPDSMLIFLFTYQALCIIILGVMGVVNLKMDNNKSIKESSAIHGLWIRVLAFIVVTMFTMMYCVVSNIESPDYLICRTLELVFLSVILVVVVLFMTGIKEAVSVSEMRAYREIKDEGNTDDSTYLVNNNVYSPVNQRW